MTLAKPLRLLLTFWLALLLVLAFSITSTNTAIHTAHAATLANLNPALRAHVSGPASLALDPAANRSAAVRQERTFYYPTSSDGCGGNLGDNIKVNQNCLNIADPNLQGRAQANNETSISYDPSNPNRVTASDNDYRRGDGHCYGAYSRDQGASFADTTIPHSFTRGNKGNIQGPDGNPDTFGASRIYWQAGGDTSNEWDTKGNAYYSCQVFNRGSAPNGPTTQQDQSSALLVYRSTRNGGASTNFPGRYVIAETNAAGDPFLLEDKQLITVDNHVGSPHQDRVYVTWTEFTSNGNGTAYVYESYSPDYGETWSPKVLVTPKTGPCGVSINPGGGCDNNQFSQPFTAPDGTLYVVYSNFNGVDYTGDPNKTAAPARFQVLISRSDDGGVSFGPPRKVGDYYELPDCATYQNGKNNGRACVPEKGPTSNSIFRASNYAVGMVNPAKPKEISVSYGSYINRYSNEGNGCVPTGSNPISTAGYYTGVKTPGACNNKILLSVSQDGGNTFTGTTTDPRAMQTVNTAPNQRQTDQWFQWLHYGSTSRGGGHGNGGNNGQGDGSSLLAVSYYDRQYGNDEVTGYSDFSLSGSSDLQHFGVRRVTSGSMPTPTQFTGPIGEHGVFWGDYTGLTVIGDLALPLWSDTRPLDLFICPPGNTGPPAPGPAPGNPPRVCTQVDQTTGMTANDQDVFTARVTVPTGGDADGGNGSGGGGGGGGGGVGR